MRRLIKITNLTILLLIILPIGCAHLQGGEEEKMQNLAGNLVMLTAAVEATVRFENPPSDITDEDLLRLATRDDPKLLDEFQYYKILILKKDRHAIVLLCTKDGKGGLLEDAGCTPGLDRHLWRDQLPCNFTLSIENLCKPNL